MKQLLVVEAEVARALATGQPVVALESTLIVHGLPWPTNLDTARQMEEAIRTRAAIPATIAVVAGQPCIGLAPRTVEELARKQDALKAGRRDLAAAMAQKRTAATTVSATMFLAHSAGIRVFATGGIGGAHPDAIQPWDISADLVELARTPVAVVCAGAKSILDIPRTLEILETLGVPVVGYQTDEFPAFYLRSSGEPVSARVETAAEAAALVKAHWALQGGGVLIAQPVPEDVALEPTLFQTALDHAHQQAVKAGIRGKALTPFLLRKLAEATGGKTWQANQKLAVANASLGAELACSIGR